MITPYYDLFVEILFIWMICTGIFKLCVGISSINLKNKAEESMSDIIQGIVLLTMSAWILW